MDIEGLFGMLVSNAEAVGCIDFYLRDVLNKLSKRVICTPQGIDLTSYTG